MLNKNQLIAILSSTICSVSLFFLIRLAYNDRMYLMQSSKPRLSMFCMIHMYTIVMMLWFARLRTIIDHVLWGFVLSIVITVAVTCLEVYIRINRMFNTSYSLQTVYPMELAYLNCYFLVYMYGSSCAFLTGLYLIMTKCCTFIQQIKIKRAIKDSIIPINHSEITKQLQCPICILPFEEQSQQKLLKIKCGHIFHEQCLLQWIRVNQSCPTCRFHVFQALERQQVNIEVVRI